MFLFLYITVKDSKLVLRPLLGALLAAGPMCARHAGPMNAQRALFAAALAALIATAAAYAPAGAVLGARRGAITCPARSRLGGLTPIAVPPHRALSSPLLRMAAGGDASDPGDKLREAEAELDDAIASSDVNAMNKWMKVIERLQPEGGGSAPAVKKMTKQEEEAAIRELLGRIDDNAAGDVADALASAELESMALAAAAAEAELDEAIAASDAPGIAAAVQRLQQLQGTGAGNSAMDWSALPGPDVEREIAEALEQAALEQGEDADDAGLLEDLLNADLSTRVEAARRIVEESVAANDARALANSISVLGRLLGTAATADALQADDNLKSVELALRAVGIDNTASAEAAADIADALMRALREEERDAGEEEDAVLAVAGDLEDDGMTWDGMRDSKTVVAAAGALLEDAAARSDADDIRDALGILRDFVTGDAPPGAGLSQREVDAVMGAYSGRQVPVEEVIAVSDALAQAELDQLGDASLVADMLDPLLATQVAEAALDEAVAANDAQATADAMAALASLRGGDSPLPAGSPRGGAEILASVMDWDVGAPDAAIADVAAALAAAELEEEQGGAAGGGGGGAGEGQSSTSTAAKAVLDDLMEVLGDDEEEGGTWEEEAEEEEEEEEEGVYLVDDDALADDADWKKQVGCKKFLGLGFRV
jgi:hypothetical protein